jgi:hypothetical protein
MLSTDGGWHAEQLTETHLQSWTKILLSAMADFAREPTVSI